MTSSRPVRIPSLPSDEWDEATRSELDSTVATSRSRPVHLPAVIARHPTFLAPYLEWAKAVALRGVLDRRQAAILALRTAWNSSSEFEWGVHAERAADGGLLTDDEVASVAVGVGAWSDLDAALIAAADELIEAGEISESTWTLLAGELDDAALIEICLTVGHYTMLSMVANSTGVVGEAHWPELGGSLTG